MSASASAPAAAVQRSAVSLVSQLLRPSAVTTQSLNIEALQMLKDKMSGAASAASSAGASTAATPAAAAAGASSVTGSAADLSTWSWPLFVRSQLPPSGNSPGSPEVVATKSAFQAFLAAVAQMVDDERAGAALSDTAAMVYNACRRLQADEDAATAAEQAARAATSTGADSFAAAAPASASLLAELKALNAAARSGVEKRSGGRVGDVSWKRCQTLARDLRRLASDMHASYNKTKLMRELKRMDSGSNDDSASGLFIPAPRIDTATSGPLLEREFGSDLPIMLSGEMEDADGADSDDEALARSELASKPVRDVLKLLRERMHRMGLHAAPAASVPAVLSSDSGLGLAPSAADSSSSEWEYSDSEAEDIDAGQSSEDEAAHIEHKLADMHRQQVRVLNEPRPAPYSSGVPVGILPSNAVQWWSWLVTQCDRFVTYSDAGVPVVTNQEIAQQLLSIMQSSKQTIENDLLDLLGFDCLDLLPILLENRKEIRMINSQHQAAARQSSKERQAQEAEQTRKAPDGSVVRGLVGISIQTSSEIEAAKNRKRSDRRMLRRSAREPTGASSKTLIDEAKLDAQASSLKSWISANASQSVSQLPSGSTRVQHKGYEEVFIPPMKKPEVDESKLRLISESFDSFAQQAFPKTKTLNRIQSRVYESAYHHNNNLLICAPTGAGKTNVAMMCVLREINQHIVNGVLMKDMFKMVYVAPMKALAQEVQTTFQKRLGPLGILVKELTGDMQLTKKELSETQLIVTTPEKWDVVTRKNHDGGSGGTGLMSLVKLLIIDECHLLNEDRGPVLEILVARTLRLVESSQQMCRIVGLSATLPNYNDVAVFVRADPKVGLFHFDATYRPVPLSQTFIGVTEPNQMRRLQSMNEITYKKCLERVKQGAQVMIFVHSRRDTVKTAKFLRDAAQTDENLALFDMTKDPQYSAFERKVQRSRNSDMSELFQYGFSMHHAGMVRPDRTLIEQAFAAGLVKVLVCTATLAWGVNLPAQTVIIKGTQIYNAEKGGFEDVGMLDIMQIFGRAGRPQFCGGVDECGDAVLICEHDKLNKYLNLLTHQLPIESQFIKELPNHLNAEIILGTVTTLNEAIQWLSYTYLYTRMLRNPMAYGISYDDMQFDELLVQHRSKLIIDATKLLMRCRMVKFDQRTGQFYSTDVGRVASHYYLHFESIELYNTLLAPTMTDEDVLHLLASSKEFAQIKTRDEEVGELEKLQKKYMPVKVKGGMDSNTGKQNLLLQVYISNGLIDTPTLISDSYFIQQSAGRICRALFEMVLKRGKAFLAAKFLTFAQMIEKKIWSFQTPLRQFLVGVNAGHSKAGDSHGGPHGGLLKMPTIMKLEERGLTLDQLVEMDGGEIGRILKHDTMGHTVKQCLGLIPFLSVEAKVQPITRAVLRIDMELRAEFTWSDKQHGTVEPFWIWIEDTNNEHIYHSESFLLHKHQKDQVHKLTFTIPIFEPLPPQYYIVIKSDRWMGSENVHTLNFKHLILPDVYPNDTQLLDLHPLPRSALMNPAFEALYEKKFTHFNPIQTQIFHTLYHTDENILCGAPTGSGKTVISELAMLRLFSNHPGAKVVYIAPLKALARERIEDWTSARSFQGLLGKKIVELTGDTAPDQRAIIDSDIIITTPEKFDGISRQWQTRSYVRTIGLVIIDEIHLLGADRGPVLEVIVSRMRYISSHTATPIRIVGLSTALSNARDLGSWLGIDKVGLFNFPPSVRPVPLTVHVQGFAGKHYCPRMATMNKPIHKAILQHSPEKPVLVFVSSRRQTRLTALDLIALSAADGNPRKWLHMSEQSLQQALAHVKDANLKNMLSFGVGAHHAGLHARDRQVVEKLFLERKIQILVCTSTLAWGVNFPAHCVIVKGTEYYDAKVKRYVDFPITDVLQMIGRAGRPQFDTEAKAVVLVHEPKKAFYMSFLHSPFPVESSLLSQLHDHVNAEICASGTIRSVGDFLDYLSWTFFFRRLLLNPSYYGLEGTDADSLNKFLLDLVLGVLGDLERAGLIMQDDEQKLVPLALGKIASFYYLNYRTMVVFSERLKPDSDAERLLVVLANAKEFEELPVRHNEDKENADMNRSMRWSVDTSSFDSPHTKTHMLLQAHMSRLDFAVQDYYLDLKSVLDQAIRVLQAMVDTCAEAGWLAATLQALLLMQMVVQGRWHDDSPLLNMPGVQNNQKLQQALHGEGWHVMPRLLAADKQKVAVVCRRAHATEKEVAEFMELLGRLPVVNMQLAAASASANQQQQPKPLPLSAQTPLQLAPGSTFTLHVSLHRRNANPNVRIFTPVFSKPKDEGWFLLVGLSALPVAPGSPPRAPAPTDELVAIKRVNNLKQRHTVQLKIQLPPHVATTHCYTVYLVSDSYLGFDQQMTFRVSTSGLAGASASAPRNAQVDAAAAAADPDDIYN